MKGLLYKYFRQNILLITIASVVPSVMLILMFVTSNIGRVDRDYIHGTYYDISNDDSNTLMIMMFLLIGYFIAQLIHAGLLKNEELKKWAYFTVASPKGIRGVVYERYVFMLMVCGMTYIVTSITNMIYLTVGAWNGFDNVLSLSGIITAFFYIELLSIAVEMVFTSRFSTLQGGHVKFVLFVGAVLIFFIILMFAPLPDGDDLADKIFGFIMKILNGEVPTWVLTLMSALPLIAIASYILSYFISCRLYMKGVDSYEK